MAFSFHLATCGKKFLSNRSCESLHNTQRTSHCLAPCKKAKTSFSPRRQLTFLVLVVFIHIHEALLPEAESAHLPPAALWNKFQINAHTRQHAGGEITHCKKIIIAGCQTVAMKGILWPVAWKWKIHLINGWWKIRGTLDFVIMNWACVRNSQFKYLGGTEIYAKHGPPSIF